MVHMCAYTLHEWPTSSGTPRRRPPTSRHGVDFADAATVLHDEVAITMKDESAGEERFVTIGMDALARVLVVVYTWRGDRPRLISARLVSPRPRNAHNTRSDHEG
jgi:uncharacterized DUF497 family protein